MNISQRTFNAVQRRVQKFSQSENAVLSYTVNWSPVLQSDTIATSTWSTEQSSVTISSESNTNTTATANITGPVGTAVIINKITTASGITDERKIILSITDNSEPVSNPQDYC